MKERKERKRREKGSIRYIPNDLLSASEGEEKREGREKETRTFREVGRKSIGFFVFIYLYIIYIYILFSCI